MLFVLIYILWPLEIVDGGADGEERERDDGEIERWLGEREERMMGKNFFALGQKDFFALELFPI